MKVTRLVEDWFSTTARRRGRSYFRQQRVAPLRVDDGVLRGQVRGTRVYDVELPMHQDDDRWPGECSCPVGRWGPCKHLWAAWEAAAASGVVAEEGQVRAGPKGNDKTGVLVRSKTKKTDAERNAHEEVDLEDEFEEDYDNDIGDDDFDDWEDLEPEELEQLYDPEGFLDDGLESAAESTLQDLLRSGRQPPASPWTGLSDTGQRLCYLLDVSAVREEGDAVIRTLRQQRSKKGGWRQPVDYSHYNDDLHRQDATDRRIFAYLTGPKRTTYDTYERHNRGRPFLLDEDQEELLLPLLCGTGRLFRSHEDIMEDRPLHLDEGSPFRFELDVEPAAKAKGSAKGVRKKAAGKRVRKKAAGKGVRKKAAGKRAGKKTNEQGCVLCGRLVRGEESFPVSDVDLCLGRYLVAGHRLVGVEDGDAGSLLRGLVDFGPDDPALRFEGDVELVAGLSSLPALPALAPALAERLPTPEQEPQARLRVEGSPKGHGGEVLACSIHFQYGEGRLVAADEPRPLLPHHNGAQAARRNLDVERARLAEFLAAGGQAWHKVDAFGNRQGSHGRVRRHDLQTLLPELLGRGWSVELRDHKLRSPGSFSFGVSSGIDWFDLQGALAFDDQEVSLPALLAAVQKDDGFVRLLDGSIGLLPEEWRARLAPLLSLGQRTDSGLRFQQSQGLILDVLLATRSQEQETHLQVDQTFARLRQKLQSFAGVQPRKEPRGFRGELRPYQRQGLGWLRFLEDMGLGGCLADDMGLGKTVQVLALLEARRQASSRHRNRNRNRNRNKQVAPSQETPSLSLIVAPRSLVTNWILEAARFTPRLRPLDFSGPQRWDLLGEAADHDVLLTTYGTLRRDIQILKDQPFDYVILDESQAIKNSDSQSAKAVRLLRARHRLALSGTPIENHLGELWSLFEFLNPGMLGRSRAFANLVGKKAPDEGQRQRQQALGRALRPFFLRRTKEQVLPDLPKKTEQTIYCELNKNQAREYDRLKTHFQQTLLRRAEREGLGRLKIHVLEALLRLRQAACHPGLLDDKLLEKKPGSKRPATAKLDALLPMLEEVIEGGHKALVFSQFTKFLGIVRQVLDQKGLRYEYLDGKTRKRQERVDRFQQDPDCPLFLISLKAGGLGLNLTAADYVFLLDPWWNPAVERQALGRAHRIGQQRKVTLYRLIAKDTVEEKVLELQERKKELVAGILGEGGAVLKQLTAEDLELLLG